MLCILYHVRWYFRQNKHYVKLYISFFPSADLHLFSFFSFNINTFRNKYFHNIRKNSKKYLIFDKFDIFVINDTVFISSKFVLFKTLGCCFIPKSKKIIFDLRRFNISLSGRNENIPFKKWQISHSSIYKFGLSVCLGVCLFVCLSVCQKTSKLLNRSGPNFLWDI